MPLHSCPFHPLPAGTGHFLFPPPGRGALSEKGFPSPFLEIPWPVAPKPGRATSSPSGVRRFFPGSAHREVRVDTVARPPHRSAKSARARLLSFAPLPVPFHAQENNSGRKEETIEICLSLVRHFQSFDARSSARKNPASNPARGVLCSLFGADTRKADTNPSGKAPPVPSLLPPSGPDPPQAP